ncbi:MAG: cytochrome c biogenesis protein CcsA [Candidatus Omnitrophica bacterium]|nr:cytochrome c biogenesis protein CcsA [Candidatus Omnitrophota bacterium]
MKKMTFTFLLAGLFLFPSALQAARNETLEAVLSRIPVQDAGRAKPFAAFAREAMIFITGRGQFENRSAAVSLWEWMADPQVWSGEPILPVKHLELRKEFSSDLVRNRIAPNLVLNDLAFAGKVNAARQKDQAKQRLTALERKEIELYQRAQLFSAIASARAPGFIPHPQEPKIAWVPLEAFTSQEGIHILENLFPAAAVRDVQDSLGHLLDRLKGGQAEEAVLAAEGFSGTLKNLLLSRDIALDETAIARELLYLKLKPFHLAWILYLISIFIWLAPQKKKVMSRVGLGFFISGFLIHSFGFVLRMLIAGRPPVTNMYESIIWVSWAAVLFSLILLFFYPSAHLPVIAASVATFALLIGESFPTFLDASISPLVPVLRSNYWLTIHVLTITLGYGAFALNWGIAHVLLYSLAFRKKKELQNSLGEYLYRSLQIGVIFLTAGTILGGVWAADSWGRFWGWDPKETWALIAILAYLAVLHSRTAGWLDMFGVAFWSALCFLTVLMAWYGVNFVLGAGLHSYGFGGGGLPYVAAFIVSDLLLILYFARRFKTKGRHG